MIVFATGDDSGVKKKQMPCLGRIQKGFATGQPVWDSKFLSQINKKPKILK